MRLPNAEYAVVEESKVARYLLDPTNPRNQGKAAFFLSFGFTAPRWQAMASALREHANRYDVTIIETTGHGVTYRVVGALTTPDGRNPIVRTVWIVLHEDDIPRLVTALPDERRRR
jgi:hypothetical protein